MADAPLFVVEKCQIEIEHAEIVTTMEEIVRRNNGVAHTKCRQHQKNVITIFDAENCRWQCEKHQRINENLWQWRVEENNSNIQLLIKFHEYVK